VVALKHDPEKWIPVFGKDHAQTALVIRRDEFTKNERLMTQPSAAEKRKTFRKLHETGCFVIPNPWNVGSARYLQSLGFPALATTSSGYAHAQGYADGALGSDAVLAHFRELAAATDVPLNADFEDGLADDLEGLSQNVTRCVATGVAGLSIEDSPNNSATPLYPVDVAVARVKAARAAIDRAGGDVIFTARAEGFIRGVPDLDDVIRRLRAFKDAGADCLYAPGIKTREQIEAVVRAVAPKPVNFLNSGAFGFTVEDLAGMGVRRISVGGSLARVAMHAFIRVATEIARDGKFDGFAGLISNPELNKFFSEDRKKDASS
jgi:2-methylisocitrate lyase-like PEP mutase family enzyme